MIPVPCHPDCLAMAYALKLNGNVIPLTGMIDPQFLLHGEGNTIMYEKNDQMRGELFKSLLDGRLAHPRHLSLKQLLCCLAAGAGAGHGQL